MGIVKRRLTAFASRVHRWLLWPAAFAVFCWAFSGMLHPIMSWTGPQATAFRPPPLAGVSQSDLLCGSSDQGKAQCTEGVFDLAALPDDKVPEAALVKVVPGEYGNLLQITLDPHRPRYYWRLNDGVFLPEQDPQQARWLASYYTGQAQERIAKVSMLSEFSDEYPWVNRLLPVYRVEFDDESRHVAFVYTETGALAGLTNKGKTRLQGLFRALHSWSWLDSLGPLRVVIIGLLMLALLLMSLSGLVFLFTRPWRAMLASRRWHKALGYVVSIPLCMWSFSGFYHLLQSEWLASESGVRLTRQIPLNEIDLYRLKRLVDRAAGLSGINSVNLLPTAQGLMLRVSGQHKLAQKPDRKARFDGIPAEAAVSYYEPQTGNPVKGFDDMTYARWLAGQFYPGTEAQIQDIQQVTRFGGGYDFRNKRLPVWRVTIEDSAATHLYIDTHSGVLADQSAASGRLESLSFSFLHKWNMLTPLTGRPGRDSIIVLVIVLALGLAVAGLIMHLRRR